MLGVGRAAPAQFPATGREFTRHPARGPEGPLGGISANKAYAENIDFNRPFQKERHDQQVMSFFLGSSRQRRLSFRRPAFYGAEEAASLNERPTNLY